MEVVFEKRFLKDVEKIKDKKVIQRIEVKIEEVSSIAEAHHPEDINDLPEIPSMVKMQGFNQFYRIRVGDYRLGISIEIKIEEKNDTFRFIRCLHRKDIYKKFP